MHKSKDKDLNNTRVRFEILWFPNYWYWNLAALFNWLCSPKQIEQDSYHVDIVDFILKSSIAQNSEINSTLTEKLIIVSNAQKDIVIDYKWSPVSLFIF